MFVSDPREGTGPLVPTGPGRLNRPLVSLLHPFSVEAMVGVPIRLIPHQLLFSLGDYYSVCTGGDSDVSS